MDKNSIELEPISEFTDYLSNDSDTTLSSITIEDNVNEAEIANEALINAIINAYDQYSTFSNKLELKTANILKRKTRLGIFHHHGQKGLFRALLVKNELLLSYSPRFALHDHFKRMQKPWYIRWFIRSEESLNPHSFDTRLLQELNQFESVRDLFLIRDRKKYLYSGFFFTKKRRNRFEGKMKLRTKKQRRRARRYIGNCNWAISLHL